jgi:hypothetical protein
MPAGMTEQELDLWLDDLIDEYFKKRTPEFNHVAKLQAKTRILKERKAMEAMTPEQILELVEEKLKEIAVD